MLVRALRVVLLPACMAAGWAQGGEPTGDTEFRNGMARFYAAWLGKNIFSGAYEVHQKLTVGDTVREESAEVRLTFDPSTQHFICEKHAWTVPPRGAGRAYRYWFYRWDGKVSVRGSSSEPRMAMVDGHWLEKLADVPVGTPLCSSVTLSSTSTSPASLCPPLEAMTQAMGLTLDGKNAGGQIADIWKNPNAQWERPAPTTAADQVQLTMGKKRFTFDTKLGLLTALQDEGSPRLSWQITKFTDRLPAEMTLKRIEEGTLPGLELQCRAQPGQCGIMSRDQFEALLKQPFPPDVGVTDLSGSRLGNGVRVLVVPAGPLKLQR